MRNAECRMQNEGHHSAFSIRNSAFSILFLLVFFLSPVLSLTAASNYDIFYPNPYIVEPDTTKVIYPIPVNTGNPLWDLMFRQMTN